MTVRDPLSPEPADGGGYVGHARDYRLASDDPAVSEKVGRTFAHQIRQRSRGELGNKWHQMASRRGRHFEPRREALAVACR